MSGSATWPKTTWAQHSGWSASTTGVWRKGSTCGSIMIDLEQRQVVDVLADRSAQGIAEWLEQHPEIEIVSRDRCGLYARCGVPKDRLRVRFRGARVPPSPRRRLSRVAVPWISKLRNIAGLREKGTVRSDWT